MRGEADVVTFNLTDNPLIISFTEVKTKGDIKKLVFMSIKKK